MLLAGCATAAGGSLEGGTTAAQAAGTGSITLGRVDDLARCETGDRREVLIDLDRNGTPDVRKLYAKTADGGETIACREADVNLDGKKDIFVFYDERGQVIRDELDLDRDSSIDIISTWVRGQVVKQELDTNGDGKIDRVRHLDGKVPTRLEGDTDGDSRVDYWEYYDAGRLVRAGYDENGDGRADRWVRDDEIEENPGALENPATTPTPAGEASPDKAEVPAEGSNKSTPEASPDEN